MSRSRIRLLVSLVAVIAVDQIVQLAMLDGGYLGSCRIAPFAPPIFAQVQSDSLDRIRSHLATGDASRSC